ncbi:glycosyltransferase family 4 protein [Asticcacaulis sp.]|uniref:glycosyltransferase family 4 protein n=1 Tax=Asticcacaulis sp. TaxID=1872648 RepID=UPI0031DD26FE
MKIMVIGLRAAFGTQGGIESHVRDIMTSMAQSRGRECSIEIIERKRFVSTNRSLPKGIAALKLTQIWCPKSTSLEAIVHSFLATLYAGFKRPDILHIHGIGPSLVAPLARLLGLKIVVTHHGEDYGRDKWGAFAKLMLRLGEYFASNFSNARIVIAPGLDEKLQTKFARKFNYIPNAVPKCNRIKRGPILGKFELRPGKYLLHVGRIVPEKCQLDLIEAFKTLETDWNLVLVGGSDHESEYSRSVLNGAQTDSRVVMTGSLDREAVAELLSHAGGFALPSTHEGLPIALLEAMSYGLPIIVSALPTLISLNLPSEVYVIPKDISDLSAKIQNLIDNSPKEPIPHRWEKHLDMFKLENVTEGTFKVYQTIFKN